MRLRLSLSVGRKLAASAALALLLLVGLVGVIWNETTNTFAEQAADARGRAAMRVLDDAADRLREVAVLERDMLLTHDAAEQATAWERVASAVFQGMTIAEQGARDFAAPAVTAATERLAAAVEDYRAALELVSMHRGQLIYARDEQLFPRSSEYDSLFEAVVAGVGFDLTGELQEDARQRLLTVHGAVNDTRLGVQRLLATGDETLMRRVRRGMAQARVHSRGFSAMPVPPRMLEEFGRLAAKVQEIVEATDGVLTAGEDVAKVRHQQVEPARAALRQALAEIDEAASQVAAAQNARVAQQAETMRVGTLWAGLAIALVLVLSGVLMGRSVGAPLRRLAAVVARIAGGDAHATVPDQGRGDEIGAIARAIGGLRDTVGQAFAQGQMIEQLPAAVVSADPRAGLRITYVNEEARRLFGQLQALLPRDAGGLVGQGIDILLPEAGRALQVLADASRLPHSARLQLGPEVLELRASAIRDAKGAHVATMLTLSLATEKVQLANTFETEVGGVVGAVAERSARLQDSALALSAAAATSGKEAAAVAAAGSRAQGDVQAVAAAAEEMANSVGEISRQVSEAAQVAGRAVAEARATDATVQGLSEAASRIGDVVKLIGDIAGQTNLLALNATIEAARAGEAGKGFAVVASEVKSLAGQTARATEEIAGQIGQTPQATAQAVSAIRGIGATVERTSEIATAIAAAVEEQGAATQEIARSAAQVAEATQTVAQRIEGVRGAAESTGSAAVTMRDDSATLASQATLLRDKTGNFLRAVRAL